MVTSPTLPDASLTERICDETIRLHKRRMVSDGVYTITAGACAFGLYKLRTSGVEFDDVSTALVTATYYLNLFNTGLGVALLGLQGLDYRLAKQYLQRQKP